MVTVSTLCWCPDRLWSSVLGLVLPHPQTAEWFLPLSWNDIKKNGIYSSEDSSSDDSDNESISEKNRSRKYKSKNKVWDKIFASLTALNTRMDHQQSQNFQYPQQPSYAQQKSYSQQQSYRPNGNNFRGRGRGRGNGYRGIYNNGNNKRSNGNNIHAR